MFTGDWLPEARLFPDTDEGRRARDACFSEMNAHREGRLVWAWTIVLFVTLFAGFAMRITGTFESPLVWTVTLPAVLLGTLAMRRYFRRLGIVMRAKLVELGLCRSCGYSLYGNTSGRCPKCGTVQAAPLIAHVPGSVPSVSARDPDHHIRSRAKLCTAILFFAATVLGYGVSQFVTWTNGSSFAPFWGWLMTVSFLGICLSVLCFVAGFAFGFAGQGAPVLGSVGRTSLLTGVYLGALAVATAVLAMALGAVFL